MKKILSIIISAAMLAASSALPAAAEELELQDYTAADYDIVDQNIDYNDDASATVTNTIDDTKAMQFGDTTTRVFSTSINTTEEFFLGFDFCFDNESGYIETPKYKSNGGVDKVGLTLSYDGTNLRTATASSSYQTLGALTLNEWYTAEVEGKTGSGAQYTTFRLYKYVDGAKTLVQETKNLNFRNISSEGRSFNGMGVKNASLDNVRLIQEKPDAITLSATGDATEINAGQSLAYDYAMTRKGNDITKYGVTWAIYNEAGDAAYDGTDITISDSGIVSAGINTATTTVTVRASVTFGEKELTGTKQLTVKAVDVGDEKFDTITISGESEVKAGTSTQYSYTATLAGVDVTDKVTDEDVVWSIYDASGIVQNNNVNISAENGLLTIKDSVLPQTITLRAASKSGVVISGKQIGIAWADSQTEKPIAYDACETEHTDTDFAESIDGSRAYTTTNNVTYGIGDQTAYTVTDVDIKFTNTNGAGFTLLNNNGSENSNIRINNGALAQQTSSSNWTTIISSDDMDFNAWYHIEFLYLNGNTSGYNVYKYDSNGDKTLVAAKTNCNRRNDKPYGQIKFSANVTIDNFKVVTAAPNEVTLTAPGQYVFTGATAQFTAAVSRNGHVMDNYGGLTWEVLDSAGLPIIDDTVSVDSTGLLTVSAMASAQTVKVRVASPSGQSDSKEITIQTQDVFAITNVGVNEDKTVIEKIYFDKMYAYDDSVVFILAIKGEDGKLKGVRTINAYGDRYSIGENSVAADLALPSDFDSETDKIETMVWTSFK